jgi:hypothetical protein
MSSTRIESAEGLPGSIGVWLVVEDEVAAVGDSTSPDWPESDVPPHAVVMNANDRTAMDRPKEAGAMRVSVRTVRRILPSANRAV